MTCTRHGGKDAGSIYCKFCDAEQAHPTEPQGDDKLNYSGGGRISVSVESIVNSPKVQRQVAGVREIEKQAEREGAEPVAWKIIWSGEHRAYWRANGAGYTVVESEAGHYTQEEAERVTKHCGPEKMIEIRPAPSSADGLYEVALELRLALWPVVDYHKMDSLKSRFDAALALSRQAPSTAERGLECPICKETGLVDQVSFVDSSKTIKRSCEACHGKGVLRSRQAPRGEDHEN